LWDESNPFVPGEPVQDDEFGGALAAGDFDGNGFVDLAIGVPGATVGTETLAGAVVVLFGSATGLTSGASQRWTQDTTGIQDSAEPNDNFGAALAAGDFHADGDMDLAIGVPNEGFGSVSEAGAVAVLYGSASGLSATYNQLWGQDSTNIQDTSESIDRFGSALAAGDFDGNGQGDLAVGVPREDVGSVTDAGAVNVIYGSNQGLSATGNQFWNQDSSGVNNMAEDGDMFGGALGAGEFGNGSQSDLAIGEETEDVKSALDAGGVNVLYGGSSGLSSTGDQFWSQDSQGINGTAEQSDFFGASLAGGDFDGDGQADLGVGAAYEQLSGMNTAGAVNVIYGSGAGLSSTGDQFWNQDSADVEGEVEAGDFFGSALASG
jgi:FG-GAP repeat protein